MYERLFPAANHAVSALGMGCMRLPTRKEAGNPIDRPAAIRLIRHLIDSGVTYVDTATAITTAPAKGWSAKR